MRNVAKPPVAPKPVDSSLIWNKFSDRLEGYIRKHVSHAEDARDLLQDVFIKIHTNSITLRDDNKLSSWVFQLTRNTIIDYYRKSTRFTPAVTHQRLEAVELDQYQDMLPCLMPFLNQLDPGERSLIEKIDLDGYSQKELARELNLPYSTLKTKVQRARKKLKQLFLECCEFKWGKQGHPVEMIMPNGCSGCSEG